MFSFLFRANIDGASRQAEQHYASSTTLPVSHERADTSFRFLESQNALKAAFNPRVTLLGSKRHLLSNKK